MLGVDFVISALFDTSGFRPGGDCATIVRAISGNAEPNTDKLIRRMRPTLMPNARSQSAKQDSLDCNTLEILMFKGNPLARTLRFFRQCLILYSSCPRKWGSTSTYTVSSHR